MSEAYREAARARLEALRRELQEREAQLAKAADVALRTEQSRKISGKEIRQRILTGVLLLGFILSFTIDRFGGWRAALFVGALIYVNLGTRTGPRTRNERRAIEARLTERARLAHAEREKWRVSCTEKESEIAETEALLVVEEKREQ